MPPRKRNSQEKIIAQFKAAHGDRYDYSRVVYQTVHDKVTIVCREHGPFEQNPKKHRSGAGCLKCVPDKIRATCMSRYGVDNPAKTEDARAHNSEIMKRQSASGMLKRGMIRKFGTDVVLRVPEIKEKVRKTMIKRHGVLNPYQINVPARMAKATKTRIAKGDWVHPSQLRAFIRYKRVAWKLTEQNIREFKATWLMEGRSRKMQLDHIYSLHDAFRHGVAPEIVASVCNLQLLPHRVNLAKGADSWMTLEDLLTLIQIQKSLGSNFSMGELTVNLDM